MAFVHGKSGKVMVNTSHMSADIRQWNASSRRDIADTTALQDGGVKGLPGLFEGTIGIEGHFDSTAGRLYAIANAASGTDNGLLVTIMPEGDAIGMPAIFAQCDIEDFEVESEVDKAVSIKIEAAADTLVDMGVSQKVWTQQAPGTVNSASVDNLAATTNGGAGILHVTAVSGGGNQVVKIQHSTDDSAWADLITFTTVTAATQQRVEVAAGTTVNRYTRATSVCTTGTYTHQLSFARR